MVNGKLEFDSVELSYSGREILRSVHVKCTTGEIIGLLGRNGSGKSSLLKVVFGKSGAANKSVRYNDQALLGDYMRQRIIAYLPQSDLIPSNTSFLKAAELYKIDTLKITNAFPDLKESLNRSSGSVSGGQRRLLEVLLILFGPHPFCFFDEPFTGIMPIHIDTLEEVFASEKKHKGIIITDHLHKPIRRICDRLYLLKNGQTYPIKNEEQLVLYGYINEL